jgi:hypothetical protein
MRMINAVVGKVKELEAQLLVSAYGLDTGIHTILTTAHQQKRLYWFQNVRRWQSDGLDLG